MRASDGAFALLGCLVAVPSLVASLSTAPAPARQVTVKPLVLPEITRHAELRAGDTLAGLLGRLKMDGAEAALWAGAAEKVLDLRSLPVGLRAEAVTDVFGQTRTVRLTPDWRAAFVLERSGEGILARREALPVERELIVATGEIVSSLFAAVQQAGEEDDLGVQLADLFGWDIDFHREVQRGDTFALLVERIRANGRTVAYGPIVCARYVNQGRTYTAVRFTPTGSPAGYYDQGGRPVRKQFLRAPLRFSRLTSRFSLSRLHPILGRRMPHWGVDYAAPVGTPVMATADGVVSFVGVRNGAGNAVEVRHAGGFTSAYLHLSRAAAGIRPGTRVGQGQTIGFVGSTGLSTGPHLDYRLTQNGRPINPLHIGHDPAPALPVTELPRLVAWQQRVMALLERPGELAQAQVAALEQAAPDGLHG